MEVEEQELETLWNDVRDLSLGCTTTIDHLSSPPSPLSFLRDYVSLNKPCLISNATNHWPALSLWSQTPYLLSSLSSSTISLHLSPNGLADSITTLAGDLCFASAQVQRVPFTRALDLIAESSRELGFVAYAQEQNDCLRKEYEELAGDCDGEIEWASEALGCEPEAVNLWIGNEMSTTSFHKDHYENLYVVVCGEKRFLLLPPTDVHRMYVREYPAAKYKYYEETGIFDLELDESRRLVPWCSVNPYPSTENLENEKKKFPLYFNGPKPFEVTVKPGQILYLPSMWFHHVRQTPDDRGFTIAVNYWYDMQFDIKYAYFNFLQSLQLRSLCDGGNDDRGFRGPDSDHPIDELSVGTS